MVFYCPWNLSMVFDPFSFLGFFGPFLERVGINHNECSTSLHLWGRYNNVLDHIWCNFSVKVKMEEIMVGI